MPDLDLAAVRARCVRMLCYHGPQHESPAEVLRALAAIAGDSRTLDRYGEGGIVTAFEGDVAALLGKEAAVFLPTGTMAQQIALRIWADRKGPRHVAFHPLCHLELHEQKGYQMLHGLHAVLVGSRHRLLGLEELKRVGDPLSALLLELPQRGIGGQLPAWDDLCAMVSWARERGIALHLDGARLWETAPFYGRSHAEIAGLFDSVYVSFYKGLGGIAGCALAGPASFIAEARVWQRRHGGTVVHLFPYVLSAQAALKERVGRMAAYADKARSIAARLRRLPGIEILPEVPPTNMMHLYLRGPKAALEAAALAVAEETGVWMFGGLQPGPIPTQSVFELVVGDAAMAISDDEIAGLFEKLFAKVQASAAAAGE
jgi:threonine aldolase